MTWQVDFCAKTKNVQAILIYCPCLGITFAESYSGVVYYSTVTAATTSMGFFMCLMNIHGFSLSIMQRWTKAQMAHNALWRNLLNTAHEALEDEF